MSFTETPDASIEEIFEAMPFVSGRLRLVQDEVVRRLESRLPQAIAELNERNGWAGIKSKAIPIPNAFSIAPSVLTNDYLNHVSVGVSCQRTTHGVGAFKNEVTVAVFSIDSRIETGHQVTVHWERAELIVGVLFPFLTGCVNAEGKRCWRQLQPAETKLIEEDYADEYSGTMTTFIATQAPGNSEAWS